MFQKHLIDGIILNDSKYYSSEVCVHWLDVYFLTCMVTNNSRYDGLTVYLMCTKSQMERNMVHCYLQYYLTCILMCYFMNSRDLVLGVI